VLIADESKIKQKLQTDKKEEKMDKKEENIQELTGRVFGYATGATVMAGIQIGYRLGLYEGLATVGPCDASRLASHLSLSERHVREWLHSQTAAGLILYSSSTGHFSLSSAQKQAFTSPKNNNAYLGHVPSVILSLNEDVPKVLDSFRTGKGFSFDNKGEEFASSVYMWTGGWLRGHLVDAFNKLGISQVLEKEGTTLVDVGCGSGEALRVLARKFPKPQFYGYDISQFAIKKAKELNKEEGLADKIHVFASPIKEEIESKEEEENAKKFDVVLTHDCLHDMTDPAQVIKTIRKRIKEDGVWIAIEPVAHDFDKNLTLGVAPLLYSVSCLMCLQSGTSGDHKNEKGMYGEGLGSMGFTEKVAREMCSKGGWTGEIKVFDGTQFGNPARTVFLIKPNKDSGGVNTSHL